MPGGVVLTALGMLLCSGLLLPVQSQGPRYHGLFAVQFTGYFRDLSSIFYTPQQ